MIQSPPPPRENTTDLHVQKRDKQSVSAWFQARSQAQRLVLGYGGRGGRKEEGEKPNAGLGAFKGALSPFRSQLYKAFNTTLS